MNVVTEDIERTIVLSQEQMEHTLEDFYRCVAEEAGYKETEDTLYDCRKILVASDVQDAIIRAYQQKCPEASMNSILLRLLASGPKMCADLESGKVTIQSGFISSKSMEREEI